MSITEVQFQAQPRRDAPGEAIQGRSQWQLTWRRLRGDQVAVTSIVVILLVIVLALCAPLVAKPAGHGMDLAFPTRAERLGGRRSVPAPTASSRHRRHRP